jgi:hypothetical protein
MIQDLETPQAQAWSRFAGPSQSNTFSARSTPKRNSLLAPFSVAIRSTIVRDSPA